MSEGDLAIRLAGSVGTVPQQDWDALDPSGNPFTSHRFLDIMEQ